MAHDVTVKERSRRCPSCDTWWVGTSLDSCWMCGGPGEITHLPVVHTMSRIPSLASELPEKPEEAA